MARRPEKSPEGAEAEALTAELSSLRILSSQYDTLPPEALIVKHILAFDVQLLEAAEDIGNGGIISRQAMDGYRAQSARLKEALAAQLDSGSQEKLAA